MYAVSRELLQQAALRVGEVNTRVVACRRNLILRHTRAPLLRAGQLVHEHIIRIGMRLQDTRTGSRGVEVYTCRDAGQIEERVRYPFEWTMMRRD